MVKSSITSPNRYTTYLWGALPYWVIGNSRALDQWRISHFWTLYAEPPSKGDDPLDLHCDFVDAYAYWEVLDPEPFSWTQAQDFKSTVDGLLAQDRAIVLFHDQNVRRGLNGSYVHEVLITDHTASHYLLVGFVGGSISDFGEFLVPAERLEEAFEAARRRFELKTLEIDRPILSLKLHGTATTKPFSSSDAAAALQSHLLNLCPVDVATVKRHADWWTPPRNSTSSSETQNIYGIEAVESIAEHISACFDGGKLPDVRLLNLNYEHKGMLLERLRFLVDPQCPRAQEPLKRLQRLHGQCNRFRMLVIARLSQQRKHQETTPLFSENKFRESIASEIEICQEFIQYFSEGNY